VEDVAVETGYPTQDHSILVLPIQISRVVGNDDDGGEERMREWTVRGRRSRRVVGFDESIFSLLSG